MPPVCRAVFHNLTQALPQKRSGRFWEQGIWAHMVRKVATSARAPPRRSTRRLTSSYTSVSSIISACAHRIWSHNP